MRCDFILVMIYGIKPRAFLQSPSDASFSVGHLQKGYLNVMQKSVLLKQQALKTHMHRHMVPGAAGSV
ncbi:hypothetical protein CUU95_03400 [Vreelandella alkaliphila]|nr:hypothetical protein CUU95_03400 [Halomonas alkaliphila]